MKKLEILLFCALALGINCADTKPEIPANIDLRIINGNPAITGQFPWQAALFFQQQTGTFVFCSGAIISEMWILTAAHCAHDAQSVLVYTGIIDISLEIPPAAIVYELIVHEDFVPESLANDIALVKLSEALTLDENTQTITLSEDEVQVGTTITVSGWGQTSATNSSISPLLSYINLLTISNEQCQEMYGGTGDILADMLCAATNPSPLQSPCHGDSGGPVVVDLGSNPRHVAIASFVSDRGCESGFPSGYTRTRWYLDWIKEKTGI